MNRVLLALTFLGVQSLNNAQDQDVFARAVCDHSRFCVSQPENCDPQMIGSCQAFASWRLSTNGTELEIGLYAQSASYVAFGFSDSPSMAGSDVYACTTNNELLRSRTIGYSNSPVSLKGVSGSSIVAEDGVVRCQFSRALALGDGDIDPEFYDLNDSNGYHIIMSWDGGLIGGSITRHSPQNRFWQQERTDFTRVLTVDTTTTLSQETEKTSSTEAVESMSPSQETFETASPSVKTAETMSPSQGTVGVMSPSQKTAETMSPSQETQLPTSPSQVLYSRSVCDQTRFCTSLPGGCDPQMDNCKAFTSWRLSDDGTHVEFALYGKTSTYVAVGITPTPIMDNTDVYACTVEGVVVRSRNTGYSNSDRPLIGVINSSVTFSNGVITCRFSRVLSPDGEADPELFDLSSDRFYLLMAWNGALDGNSIRRHAGDKRFSGDSFNFTQTLSTASTPQMEIDETMTPSQKTAETMSPSQKTAETMSPSQERVETVSPSQKTAETMSPSQETQLPTSPSQVLYSRSVCDQTRFCTSLPGGCDPQMDNCKAFTSWRLSDDGTHVEFALYGKTSTYVAVGISPTPIMDNTDVYACTVEGVVVRSRNTGYSNSDRPLIGVINSSVTFSNGVITCQFSRVLSPAGEADPELFDLSSDRFYLLMAWNGALDGNSIRRHAGDKRFSGDSFNFTQTLSTASTPQMEIDETMIPSQKTAETMSPSQERVETVSPSQKTAETMSPSQETQLPTSPSQVLYSRSVCDQTRFCTSLPGGCDPQMDNCKAFTSWRLSDDGTHVEFALYGKTSTYVAVGISPTPIMDNTDVYACTVEGVVVRSRNTGYSNSDRPLIGVINSSVTFSNGVITCQFSRVLSPAGEADPELFDLSSDRFYLLMAWNGALDGNSIRRHAGDKRFSGDSFNFTQTLSTASTPEMDTSGCGTSKGCFSRPADCDPERDGSCEVFSSWVANEDRSAISIELQASTDTYIAIGFSKSGMMDDSDVYACTSNREVRRSRNGVGRRNTAQELKGVSEQSVSLTDGVIRCTFTRTAFLDDDDVLFFDLRPGNKYTILLAWGGSLSNGGDIQVHKDRIFSEDAVDLTEISEFSDDGTGDADLILRKLHGSLMVLAWLCLVSLGITTARYFKDLPGKVCGKPLWFSIHRACMTAVLLLTIVSFVIIVVAVGGFNTITSGPENIVRSLHAICGSIVTILTIINVIMAVFRPHPGEPRRNLYNWAHWAVGTTAHLMALTTILMGTSNHPEQFVVPLLPSLRSYVFWMVVAFIIFHVVLWLIFTFYQVAQNSPDSPKSYDFPLNELESIDVPHITSIEEENQIPPLMMSLYWVYASITVLVCLVIFVIIFL